MKSPLILFKKHYFSAEKHEYITRSHETFHCLKQDQKNLFLDEWKNGIHCLNISNLSLINSHIHMSEIVLLGFKIKQDWTVWRPFLSGSLACGTAPWRWRTSAVAQSKQWSVRACCGLTAEHGTDPFGLIFHLGIFAHVSAAALPLTRSGSKWRRRPDVCSSVSWRRRCGATENTKPRWALHFEVILQEIGASGTFGIPVGVRAAGSMLEQVSPEQRLVLPAWGPSWPPVLLLRPAAVWPSPPGSSPSASSTCCVWTSPWPSGWSGTRPSSTSPTWTRPTRSRTQKKRSVAATGNTRRSGTLKAWSCYPPLHMIARPATPTPGSWYLRRQVPG